MWCKGPTHIVHLYGRFLRKTSNSKLAVSTVSQLSFFLEVQLISVPAFLDMKTNAHIETGHNMVELDQCSLGGCQGQYRLTATARRTVVFKEEGRILPVYHLVNTVTHAQKRWRGFRPSETCI